MKNEKAVSSRDSFAFIVLSIRDRWFFRKISLRSFQSFSSDPKDRNGNSDWGSDHSGDDIYPG